MSTTRRWWLVSAVLLAILLGSREGLEAATPCADLDKRSIALAFDSEVEGKSLSETLARSIECTGNENRGPILLRVQTLLEDAERQCEVEKQRRRLRPGGPVDLAVKKLVEELRKETSLPQDSLPPDGTDTFCDNLRPLIVKLVEMRETNDEDRWITVKEDLTSLGNTVARLGADKGRPEPSDSISAEGARTNKPSRWGQIGDTPTIVLAVLALVTAIITGTWLVRSRRRTVTGEYLGQDPALPSASPGDFPLTDSEERASPSKREGRPPLDSSGDEDKVKALLGEIARLREDVGALRGEVKRVPVSKAEEAAIFVGRDLSPSIPEIQKAFEQAQAGLDARLQRLESQSRASAGGIDAHGALDSNLALERDFLEKSWRNLSQKEPSLVRKIESFSADERERGMRKSILKDLPHLLEEKADFLSVFQEVAVGLVDYDRKMTALSQIPDLLKGDATQAKNIQLLRVRDAFFLLGLVQITDEARKLDRFDIRKWIRGEFLRLADYFLRTYQQMDDGGRAVMPARAILVEILHYSGLGPVEIVLGRTLFDGKVHIARSDSCVPDKPDGAIVGIVKSGFLDLESNRILQRPEVVVNRV